MQYSASLGSCRNCCWRMPERVQDVVDQAERRVEQPQEDDAGGDRRGDQRDEHGQAVEADAADLAVQRDREPERADHRDGDEDHRVEQRVPDRRAERGILGQRPVVGQPDVVGRADQVVGLQGEQQRPADRDQGEDRDQDHRRRDERPPGYVLGADQALEQAGARPGSGAAGADALTWRAPHAGLLRRRAHRSAPGAQHPVDLLGGLVERLLGLRTCRAEPTGRPGRWRSRSSDRR